MIRRQIRRLPAHIVLLAEDETDVLLFPPLRASWARKGQPAKVSLTGRNARRVLFGAINLRTGRRVLLPRHRQRAVDFCAFLDELRRRYRHRPIALLLDEDSSHTAQASRARAQEIDIRLIWLPKRCPELNPMDHLWRSAKEHACANRQDTTIDVTVARAIRYLLRLTPREALRKAGVLSRRFWLRRVVSNRFRRRT
jgi:transposase